MHHQINPSLSVTHCGGHNNDLPSNSDISKAMRKIIVFTKSFLKNNR